MFESVRTDDKKAQQLFKHRDNETEHESHQSSPSLALNTQVNSAGLTLIQRMEGKSKPNSTGIPDDIKETFGQMATVNPPTIQNAGIIQKMERPPKKEEEVTIKISRVDSEYPCGSAYELPHIHRYGNECHYRDKSGFWYNLVQKGVKYVADIYLAFESINIQFKDKPKTIEALRKILAKVIVDCGGIVKKDYIPFNKRHTGTRFEKDPKDDDKDPKDDDYEGCSC